MSRLRRTVIVAPPPGERPARTLSWPHPVALGVGADRYRGVAAAAAIALPTAIRGFPSRWTRIFPVMARDGFPSPASAKISARGTPVRIAGVTAAFVAIRNAPGLAVCALYGRPHARA